MIATSGEWLGNAGVVHASATTAIPASNADNVTGKASFADAMRQSDVEKGANVVGKSQDVANGIDERVAAKNVMAKVPPRFTSTESPKQLNSKNAAIADQNGENVGSATNVVSKTMPGALPVTKSDATDDSPQGLTAALSAMPVAEAITGRIKIAAGQIGEGKTAGDGASKAKLVPGKNASRAVVSRESQAPAGVIGNSTAAGAVNPQAVPVAQVDVKSGAVAVQASTEAKYDKKPLEQGAVLPTPVVSSAGAMADAAPSGADASGAIGIPSVTASANMTTETIASHITDMPSAAIGSSIHPGNTLQIGAPPMFVKREADRATTTSASHAQGGTTGELSLNTFEVGKPGQLEVGLRGGEFGWLKVRAELGANGEVNAYLRGASASTTNLLQTTAPRIETYLGAQDVAVRSVQVEATHTHSGSSGSGLPTSSDATAGGTSQQQDSEGRRHGESVLPSTLVDDAGVLGSVEEIVPMQLVSNQNNIDVAGTGNWLSVRA